MTLFRPSNFWGKDKKTDDAYLEGVRCMQNDRIYEANAHWKLAAKNGHTSAQFNLSLLHGSGRISPLDIDFAAQCLQDAAEGTHPVATKYASWIGKAEDTSFGTIAFTQFAEKGVFTESLNPLILPIGCKLYNALCIKYNITDEILRYELDGASTSKHEYVHNFLKRTGIQSSFYKNGLNEISMGSAAEQVANDINALCGGLEKSGHTLPMIEMIRCTIAGYIISKSKYASNSQPLLGFDKFYGINNKCNFPKNGIKLKNEGVDILFIAKNNSVIYTNNSTAHLYSHVDGETKLKGRVVIFNYKSEVAKENIQIFVAFDESENFSLFNAKEYLPTRLNGITSVIFTYFIDKKITGVFSPIAQYTTQYLYTFTLYEHNGRFLLINGTQSEAYLISNDVLLHDAPDKVKREFLGAKNTQNADHSAIQSHLSNASKDKIDKKNNNYAEGKALFEKGMAHALKFESTKAIELYTESLSKSPNPSPLLNRANLLAKRLDLEAALRDLEVAKILDINQGRQFQLTIQEKILEIEIYTSAIKNRDHFTASLQENGIKFVAQKLIQVSFNIDKYALMHAATKQDTIEYFFFNELDNIKKFDDLTRFPSIEWEVYAYPDRFIQEKISNTPTDYFQSEAKMYRLLCAHADGDRYILRDAVMYYIHEYLMNYDYQGQQYTLRSDSRGVIKDAHAFLPDDFEY